MNSTISKSSKKKSFSFLDWLSQSDSLVVFGGFGILIMIAIIIIGIFQAGDPVRPNVLYNAFGAIMMGLGFIYLIFKFMGQEVMILNKSIDVGMIIYLAIVFLIMFILGN